MSPDSLAPAEAPARPSYIAPLWHTLSFLLLLGFLAALDAQHAQNAQHLQDAGSAQATVSHVPLLRLYLLPILYEWGIAAWAWAGVLFNGLRLRDLTGGRWVNWRSLALDVAIAIPFWGLWELIKRLVLLAVAQVQTPTTPYHPPSGFSKVFFWILLFVSAGICEEIVYRDTSSNNSAPPLAALPWPFSSRVCSLVHSTPTRAGRTSSSSPRWEFSTAH